MKYCHFGVSPVNYSNNARIRDFSANFLGWVILANFGGGGGVQPKSIQTNKVWTDGHWFGDSILVMQKCFSLINFSI